MNKLLRDRIARVIDDYAHLGIPSSARAELRDGLTVYIENWMRAHPDEVLDICTREE